MWIMLWFVIINNGAPAAGAIEFPTKEACEAGAMEMKRMALRAQEATTAEVPLMSTSCVQKATGKP